MKFDWSHEDRYLSNGGKGPLMARILCATDKIVTIERWNSKSNNPRRVKGRLSIAFFTSDRCGWKKMKCPDCKAKGKIFALVDGP